MKVSEKKKEANRKNAQKSTGPKSFEGKQTVSQNGVRHGLYTQALILNSPTIKEDITDYNSIIYGLDRELQPEGMLEEMLVRKAANCLWRMRRVIAAENAYVEDNLDGIDRAVTGYIRKMNDKWSDPVDDRPPEEMERIRKICIGRKMVPEENIGGYLMRYEMRLDRQLSRSLRLLLLLQERRRKMEGDCDAASEDMGQPAYYNPLADIGGEEE